MRLRTRLFHGRLTLGSLNFRLPFFHDLLGEVRDAFIGMSSQLSDCETGLALLKKGVSVKQGEKDTNSLLLRPLHSLENFSSLSGGYL